MPGGGLIGLLFFVLIFFAALTSSISLLEGPTAWAIDRFGWTRRSAAWVIGGVAFLIGVFCALGYNVLSDVRPLGFWNIFADTDILDTLDGVTGKIMMPLAGLLLAIFVGWRADRRLVDEQSGLSGGTLAAWRFPGRLGRADRGGADPAVRPVPRASGDGREATSRRFDPFDRHPSERWDLSLPGSVPRKTPASAGVTDGA